MSPPSPPEFTPMILADVKYSFSEEKKKKKSKVVYLTYVISIGSL